MVSLPNGLWMCPQKVYQVLSFSATLRQLKNFFLVAISYTLFLGLPCTIKDDDNSVLTNLNASFRSSASGIELICSSALLSENFLRIYFGSCLVVQPWFSEHNQWTVYIWPMTASLLASSAYGSSECCFNNCQFWTLHKGISHGRWPCQSTEFHSHCQHSDLKMCIQRKA